MMRLSRSPSRRSLLACILRIVKNWRRFWALIPNCDFTIGCQRFHWPSKTFRGCGTPSAPQKFCLRAGKPSGRCFPCLRVRMVVVLSKANTWRQITWHTGSLLSRIGGISNNSMVMMLAGPFQIERPNRSIRSTRVITMDCASKSTTLKGAPKKAGTRTKLSNIINPSKVIENQ